MQRFLLKTGERKEQKWQKGRQGWYWEKDRRVSSEKGMEWVVVRNRRNSSVGADRGVVSWILGLGENENLHMEFWLTFFWK